MSRTLHATTAGSPRRTTPNSPAVLCLQTYVPAASSLMVGSPSMVQVDLPLLRATPPTPRAPPV